MEIDAPTWLLLVLVPIAGGALIIGMVRRRPDWKRPMSWALAGILCFELVQQVFGLILANG